MGFSRVGKLPIPYDKSKVQVKSDGNFVSIQAGNKKLEYPLRPEITVDVQDTEVKVSPCEGQPKASAFHGLYRTLIANAVKGVTEGFSKTLILNGVGYRAQAAGNKLNLTLGYSHPIEFPIPDGIEIKVEKQTKVTISGFDKYLVGQIAANIRKYRPVEPYLGKGIRYEDEHVVRKAGKSGGK